MPRSCEDLPYGDEKPFPIKPAKITFTHYAPPSKLPTTGCVEPTAVRQSSDLLFKDLFAQSIPSAARGGDGCEDNDVVAGMWSGGAKNKDSLNLSKDFSAPPSVRKTKTTYQVTSNDVNDADEASTIISKTVMKEQFVLQSVAAAKSSSNEKLPGGKAAKKTTVDEESTTSSSPLDVAEERHPMDTRSPMRSLVEYLRKKRKRLRIAPRHAKRVEYDPHTAPPPSLMNLERRRAALETARDDFRFPFARLDPECVDVSARVKTTTGDRLGRQTSRARWGNRLSNVFRPPGWSDDPTQPSMIDDWPPEVMRTLAALMWREYDGAVLQRTMPATALADRPPEDLTSSMPIEAAVRTFARSVAVWLVTDSTALVERISRAADGAAATSADEVLLPLDERKERNADIDFVRGGRSAVSVEPRTLLDDSPPPAIAAKGGKEIPTEVCRKTDVKTMFTCGFLPRKDSSRTSRASSEKGSGNGAGKLLTEKSKTHKSAGKTSSKFREEGLQQSPTTNNPGGCCATNAVYTWPPPTSPSSSLPHPRVHFDGASIGDFGNAAKFREYLLLAAEMFVVRKEVMSVNTGRLRTVTHVTFTRSERSSVQGAAS